MNPLDNLISFFSPEAGLRRTRARYAMRIYDGAAGGRRASAWRDRHTSANSELQLAIRPLRDRSRDLVRNTPHAPRMLDVLVSHTVGTGITPVSTTGKDKVDRQVTQLWEDWTHQADVTEVLGFNAMMALALRSMIESGEVVARYIDMPLDSKVRGERAAVPMQLQLLEADYIDSFRDGIYGDIFGQDYGLQKSRMGVGLGDYDKRVGLWLWPYHPGEITTINLRPLVSEFVKQDELLHMFKMLRPGQVRGVPWFAPILTTSRDLNDFIDACNVKARVEACFSAFISNDDQSAPMMDQDPNFVGSDGMSASNPLATVTALEPGMIKELRAGQKIDFAQPTTNTQIEPIMMYNLQAMASGVGCTYDQMTGDLRQANYSSLRAGKLEFWDLVAQLQKFTVIPMFCRPIRARVINRAILAGRLPPRKDNYPCDWIVPAKAMVDPKKDFDAARNAVRAGAMTPQDFVASFGGNWRDSLESFKAYFEMADDLGVVVDTDVSKVDQHGRQPTKPDDPNAKTDDASDDAESSKEEDKEDA